MGKDRWYILIILTLFISLISFYHPETKLSPETAQINIDSQSIASLEKLQLLSADNDNFHILTRQLLIVNKNLKEIALEDKSQKVDELITLAKERQKLIEIQAKDNVISILSFLLSPGQVSQFPQEVQPYLETQYSSEGYLEAVHYDSIQSWTEYTLITEDERLSIHFVNQDPEIKPDVKTIIEGIRLGNTVIVGSGETGLKIAEEAVQYSPPRIDPLNDTDNKTIVKGNDALGEQKVAIILFRYEGAPTTPPFTKDQIAEMVFNKSMQKFYREDSYEKMWLSGDVYDWRTRNGSSYGCGWDNFQDNINFADSYVYFPNYTRLMFIHDARGCGENQYLGGFANIGKKNYTSNDGNFRASAATISDADNFFTPITLPSGGFRTFNWTAGEWLLVHEFGHGLDIWHNNNFECGQKSFPPGCHSNQYGNFFDVMGRGYYPWNNTLGNNFLAALHFGAIFKEHVKWIVSGSIQTATSAGIYKVTSIENSNSKIVKVKQKGYPQLEAYYLEKRTPIGFDNSLIDPLTIDSEKGIFISIRKTDSDGEHLAPSSYLLDASPTTFDAYDNDWYDPTLKINKTFYDAGAGISLTNLGFDPVDKSNNTLLVYVNFSSPTCMFYPPTVIPEVATINANLSDNYYGSLWPLQYYIINSDSALCNSSTFRVNFTLPPNWQVSGTALKDFNLGVGKIESLGIHRIIIPPKTAGDFIVNFTVINLNSSLNFTTSMPIHINPDDQLRLYYPLDQNINYSYALVTYTRDNSAYHRLGRLNTPSLVPGHKNNALSFNGVNDSVIANDEPHLDINGSFSVAFWFNGNKTTGSQTLAGKWNGTAGNIAWFADIAAPGGNCPLNSAIDFYVSEDGGSSDRVYVRDCNNTYQDNQWHHFVGVFDPGNSIKLYIDGQSVGIVTGNISTVTKIHVNNAPLIVGNGIAPYKGMIDEFRIYSKALNSSEVQALYIS